MALQGTLKDFSLADIFQLIGLQRKTGVLTLKAGPEVVTVQFVEGNVVGADSLHRRLEDRLGTVLVKSKQITPAQLQEALKIQKQTLRRLGDVLVEQKFIPPEGLREALRIQITQMVYRLFRWRDGDYKFSQEERLDFDRKNIQPLSAESLLMEGARILDEWPMIEKRLGPFSGVYRRSPPAETAGKGSGGMVLSSEEKLILSLVDGHRTVQDVVESSPLSEFDTSRVLFDLVERGLAEKAAAAEPATPAAKTARVHPAERERAARATGRKGALALALVAGVSFGTSAWNPLNGISVLDGSHPLWNRYVHQVSRTRLERIHHAVQVYYIQNRGYPQELSYLVERGLLRPSDLRDPWDREYRYAPLAWGYEIRGLGPFGEENPSLRVRSILPH
jgi:hypothetical protein